MGMSALEAAKQQISRYDALHIGQNNSLSHTARAVMPELVNHACSTMSTMPTHWSIRNEHTDRSCILLYWNLSTHTCTLHIT